MQARGKELMHFYESTEEKWLLMLYKIMAMYFNTEIETFMGSIFLLSLLLEWRKKEFICVLHRVF